MRLYKIKHIAIILVGAFLLIFFGIILFGRYKKEKQFEKVYNVASRLGQTSQNYIVKHETCWDVFPSRCGIYSHFITDFSLEDLESHIHLLGRKNPANEKWKVSSKTINGFEIFTDINMSTTKVLTADGVDGIANTSELENPQAKEWSLTDSEGREWSIRYFDIQNTSNRFQIDGKDIRGNIVSVMLKTK